MKLKIQRQRFESGTYYYLVYEWFWFHWVRRSGLFDTLEEAEKCAVNILEDEREQRKKKHQCIINWKVIELHIRRVMGLKEVLWGEPPLKIKKTENEK
jgi:hypothetical protein